MPSCKIKCPYCELDFDHNIDVDSSDLYETNNRDLADKLIFDAYNFKPITI